MLLADLEDELGRRLPVPTQIPLQWGWVASTKFRPATVGEPPRLTMTFALKDPAAPESARPRSAVVEYNLPDTPHAELSGPPQASGAMVATGLVDGLLVRCILGSACPREELEQFLVGLGADTFELLATDDRPLRHELPEGHQSVQEEEEEGGWFRTREDEEEDPWWLPPDPERLLASETFRVQCDVGIDPPSATVWSGSLGVLSGTRFRSEVNAPPRGLPFKMVRCRWSFQSHSDRGAPELGVSAWLRPASEDKPRQPPPSGLRLGEWHLEYFRGDPLITAEELDMIADGLVVSTA